MPELSFKFGYSFLLFSNTHKRKKKLGPSLKLGPNTWDRVSNSIQTIWAQFRDIFISFLFFFIYQNKKKSIPWTEMMCPR
jgi:hypothetical protein